VGDLIRPAAADDAPGIAALHAMSWRGWPDPARQA